MIKTDMEVARKNEVKETLYVRIAATKQRSGCLLTNRVVLRRWRLLRLRVGTPAADTLQRTLSGDGSR